MTDRKKELKEAYKNRFAEMGIVSFTSQTTGEKFVAIARDSKAEYNSNRFRLMGNNHSNKDMQDIWKKYGADDFKYELDIKLKYDDPHEDQSKKLEKMFKEYLEENPQVKTVYRQKD